MTTQSVILIAAALSVVVFVSGFVLHRAGAPYSVAILAAHKLISLSAAVLLGVAVFRAQQEASLAGVTWASLASTTLFFGTAVATGGIVSTDKPQLPVVATLHKVAPWFTVFAAAVTAFLLVR